MRCNLDKYDGEWAAVRNEFFGKLFAFYMAISPRSKRAIGKFL